MTPACAVIDDVVVIAVCTHAAIETERRSVVAQVRVTHARDVTGDVARLLVDRVVTLARELCNSR